MYDSKRSAHKKSRLELEREHSEKIFYEDNKIPHVEDIGYGFPTLFSAFPLVNIDRFDEDEIVHQINNAGDIPLDYLESESGELESKIKIFVIFF